MTIYSQEAIEVIKDIELESQAILHSFESTIKSNGLNSYKPFAVFFSDPETKQFLTISRPVEDEKDYYTAISEMLFTYSTVESKSVLLAIDTLKQINNEQHDVLEIYLACDDFCYIYSYPYKFDPSNNNFEWMYDKFSVFEIDNLEKNYTENSSEVTSTMQIMEALFLHVHLHNQFFDLFKLKSFFDHFNFEYVDLTKDQEKSLSLNLH
jgi:hypothetical protein